MTHRCPGKGGGGGRVAGHAFKGGEERGFTERNLSPRDHDTSRGGGGVGEGVCKVVGCWSEF